MPGSLFLSVGHEFLEDYYHISSDV